MLNPKLKWTRVFRIKRLSDGLFKDKGFNSRFSINGHTWLSMGAVRSHVRQNKKNLKGCAIVEYVLDQVAMELIHG